MPTELVGTVNQLAPLVEKLGVIGLLLIVVGWLIYERLRLVKLNAKTFRERDMARQIVERYRGAIVAGGGQVPDIADILQQYVEKD